VPQNAEDVHRRQGVDAIAPVAVSDDRLFRLLLVYGRDHLVGAESAGCAVNGFRYRTHRCRPAGLTRLLASVGCKRSIPARYAALQPLSP